MKTKHVVPNLLLLSVTAMTAPAAMAAGVFVPAQQRQDMVHDDARDVVYITSGSGVLRYDVASETFLSPIVLGGNLVGIDLSPDGTTLVVADSTSTDTQMSVYLVAVDQLSSLRYEAVRKVSVGKNSPYEGGAHAVAFGSDGGIRVSSRYLGSGTVPLRRLNPLTSTWATVASVGQSAMLSASGDSDTIAFAEANNSGGPWGLIDIPTGMIVRRYTDLGGRSAFNYEIATDWFGSQFAVQSSAATNVFNEEYELITTIGEGRFDRPIGIAYHPVQRVAYFPWAESREVRVYDMGSFRQIASYDFEDDFVYPGNAAYVQGRTRLSKDGSLLMVSVSGGIRLLRMYAPLEALPVTISALPGERTSFGLSGRIGNGDRTTYSIMTVPENGRVSIYDGTVTYLPRDGFIGTDTFMYRTHYGFATRDAQVTVQVGPPNVAPVATDNAAIVRNAPVSIPVLADDRDANGDALKIVAVTQPRYGQAIIEGRQIKFIPAARRWGDSTFHYTVSDGLGGLAKAKVTVRKR